jgi:cytoskeletal protein CcmA (bactofilin family)
MENGVVNEEKTTINSSTAIDGNITANEHLIVNGTIRGNVEIRSFNLFVGPGGRIEGEVHAQNVRIRGHMKGDIVATEKVDITKEANFSGKIKSKSISVEEGAYFDAFVDLGRKPSGTGAVKAASLDAPAGRANA